VDAGICISSGLCVADAPAAFRFDEDEIAEPTESAAAVDLAALMAIAYNCPSGAIRILDGDRETGSG
jgi:ferredoxin